MKWQLLEDILKNYKNTGAENENLVRTQTFIEEAFLSGAATCLICISRVKRDDAVCNNTSICFKINIFFYCRFGVA